MHKKAIPVLNRLSSQALKSIAGALAGGVTGGAAGYGVTPHIVGYADVPEARRVSAYTDAILGAILGSALGYGGKAGLKNLGIPLKAIPMAAGVGEIPPMATAKLTKEKQLADILAQTARTSSIPIALGKAIKSPVSRGAGIGAAGAGLGGLVTGLTRKQTEEELAKRESRSKMVTKDVLKYLIPAMIAGGVTGSFVKAKD